MYFFCLISGGSVPRPRQPSRPSRPSQPAQPAQRVNSRPRPTSFSPAFPAPELYVGPKYDEFGKSFSGADDYYLDDEIGNSISQISPLEGAWLKVS